MPLERTFLARCIQLAHHLLAALTTPQVQVTGKCDLGQQPTIFRELGKTWVDKVSPAAPAVLIWFQFFFAWLNLECKDVDD